MKKNYKRKILVIGVLFLLLGAGVVLGKNVQQATLSTQPIVAPTGRDWSDSFDTYEVGSPLHGQGGWYAWDNRSIATGYISNAQARSNPNSLESKWFTTEASDMVHTYSGYDTGTWVYTAWVYVPSTMVGEQYFIMMNKYIELNHVLQDWSLQVEMSASGGYIRDFDNNPATLPLVTDQWMEIRAVIDLEADVQTVYYGGTQFIQKSWKNGVAQGGQKNIACVDLWASYTSGTTSCYWDDLSLLPPVPPLSCEADGPYTGLVGQAVQFNGSASGGNEPYTWAWTFGDGGTSTLEDPTHAYAAPGIYNVTLTVTDAAQATATDTTTATITQPPLPVLEIVNVTGGLRVKAVVINSGEANATNIRVGMVCDGGWVAYNKDQTWPPFDPPIIPPDERHTITAKIIFGFGKTNIVISATCDEGVSTEVNKTAFVLGPFVLGVK